MNYTPLSVARCLLASLLGCCLVVGSALSRSRLCLERACCLETNVSTTQLAETESKTDVGKFSCLCSVAVKMAELVTVADTAAIQRNVELFSNYRDGAGMLES